MNTKFNIKQLLSMRMALLVVSLGARCGLSEDYVEGVKEENENYRKIVRKSNEISVDNAGLEFGVFVGMLSLISFEKAKEEISKVNEKQIKEASEDTEGRAAVKYNSNALKGLVSVFVIGGGKTKKIAEAPEEVTFNTESLKVQKETEEIKHSMLGAVKYILTSAMFSGKEMRPGLRVAMFMALLKSIKKSGLYKKLQEIDKKREEFEKTKDNGGVGEVSSERNEETKRLEKAKRALAELEECTKNLKEAVGKYGTDLGEYIIDWKLDLKRRSFKESKKVKLIPFSRHLPEPKKADPRRELQRALAYVKQMYTDAVYAAEKLIEKCRGEIAVLGGEVQEQGVVRQTTGSGGGGAGEETKASAAAQLGQSPGVLQLVPQRESGSQSQGGPGVVSRETAEEQQQMQDLLAGSSDSDMDKVSACEAFVITELSRYCDDGVVGTVITDTNSELNKLFSKRNTIYALNKYIISRYEKCNIPFPHFVFGIDNENGRCIEIRTYICEFLLKKIGDADPYDTKLNLRDLNSLLQEILEEAGLGQGSQSRLVNLCPRWRTTAKTKTGNMVR